MVYNEYVGAAVDSRHVRKGNLFFALKGARVDGHDFLQQVASRGAVGAVVSKEYRGENFGLALYPVDDVLAALHVEASSLIQKRAPRIIGVTGSVGKTTTKEFIAALLSSSFKVGKSEGNANSQIGMPLTVLNMSGDEEVLILEMGMSGPGQIAKLVQIAPPEVAVITKVGMSHAAFFPEGIKGIAAAKAEIFSHSKTRLGILNKNELRFETIRKEGQCTKLLCSFEEESAEYVLEKKRDRFVIIERGARSPEFSLPFSATHFCENFVLACAVARSMGVDWDLLLQEAQKLKAASLRFEILERNGIVFVNDCYNASPESIGAALHNLPACQPGGRVIGVLGEMKELGSFSQEIHEQVGRAAVQKLDQILCYGEQMDVVLSLFHAVNKQACLYSDLQELKSALHALVKKGDVVLIKGSHSNALWNVL